MRSNRFFGYAGGRTLWRMMFCALALLMICIGMLISTPAAQGQLQISNQLPSLNTYNARVFTEFYLADYKDAGENFRRGYRTAYKLGSRRHLDSVCFLTMMGECHYHVGNYADAVDLYEQALNLYLSYQNENWQSRLQLPATIQTDRNAITQARITWGASTRGASVARIPTTFGILFGRLDSERALQEGGLVDNAQVKQLNVTEVMRCASLCLHRRRVIKGPICKFDPFTSKLIAGLNVSGVGNGSVMGAYNGVLLGIAQASMEDYARASKTLNSSLQINRKDHPLTPVALVELAQIGAASKHYAAAGKVAMEASYSAAVFDQFDLIEEALGVATQLHLITDKTAFPPLENAIQWARREDARLMQVSLIHRLAESLAEGGQANLAAQVLQQANGVISNRNSLGNSVVSARLKYTGAVIEFLNGDANGGRAKLNAALKHFQKGSQWLYQLGLADKLASGGASQREADRVYEALLRDPTEEDWKTQPMESIAFLASPHVDSLERWFDIVINRKNPGRALEVGDLLRRHRFFAALPLGGRLMSLRWILHAPEKSLSKEALSQKQSFIAAHQNYQQLIDKTNQINTALELLPVKPKPGSPEERKQLKLVEELRTVSNTQESVLASFALRRQPAEMSFPPQPTLKDFQKEIGKDQVALVCVATSSYHLFLLKNNAVQYFDPINSKLMIRKVGGLLKKMGVSESALDVEAIQNTDWKAEAEALKTGLFGSIADGDWAQFRELVIVPDGVLWYLPFEAIPVAGGDGKEFLSDAINIRYSPTLGLGFGEQREPAEIKNSAVVTARMSARGDAELSYNEFADFLKSNPDAIEYQRPSSIPASYLVSLLDQLIIWSEVKSNRNQPLAMNPFQIDTKKPGSSLDSWISLPWKGAQNVVMPGLNTDGGNGLRGKLYGADLFLTSVGLMASGSRSALLSRWATGGKTAIELTKKYATELPKSGMSKALTDSRRAIRESDLDYENEPRVRAKKSDPVVKGAHPFFWAAHMPLSIPDGKLDPAMAKAADPVDPVAKPVDAKVALPGDAKAVDADQPAEMQKVAQPDKKAEPEKVEAEKVEPKKVVPKPSSGGGFVLPGQKKAIGSGSK